MDYEQLATSPLGSVVPINGTDPLTGQSFAHYAYVPAPLPTAVTLTSATWTRVAAAEAALGRLDEAARQFPEPALLRRPAIRREAQSTSALEGTYAPFETVLAADPKDRRTASLELREILNYVVAAEHGFAWVPERPITKGLVEHLQALLVAGTPGSGSMLDAFGRARSMWARADCRSNSLASSRLRQVYRSTPRFRTGSVGLRIHPATFRLSSVRRWLTISSRLSIHSSMATVASDGCSSRCRSSRTAS